MQEKNQKTFHYFSEIKWLTMGTAMLKSMRSEKVKIFVCEQGKKEKAEE